MSENQVDSRPGTKQLRSAMVELPVGVALFMVGLWASFAESSIVGIVGSLLSLCGIGLFIWGIVSLFRGIWKRIA